MQLMKVTFDRHDKEVRFDSTLAIREVDLTEFPASSTPLNNALIWLPFSLISGSEKNGQRRVL